MVPPAKHGIVDTGTQPLTGVDTRMRVTWNVTYKVTLCALLTDCSLLRTGVGITAGHWHPLHPEGSHSRQDGIVVSEYSIHRYSDNGGCCLPAPAVP